MICAFATRYYRSYYWALGARTIPWASSSSSSPMPSSSLFACLQSQCIYCANQLNSRWKSIFSNQIALNLMMLARSKDALGIFSIFSVFTSLQFVYASLSVLLQQHSTLLFSCSFAASLNRLCSLLYFQHSIIPVAISIPYWRPHWNGVAAVIRISITWLFIGLARVPALFYRCRCTDMM